MLYQFIRFPIVTPLFLLLKVKNFAMENNAKRSSYETQPSPPIPPNRDEYTKNNVQVSFVIFSATVRTNINTLVVFHIR